jgi:membrane-associated phospholipid phosphatase
LSWEKHLEHWLVLQRVSWLNWFFIDLSWLGRLGLVWVVIALVLAVLWRRPSLFLTVVVADVIADLLAELGKAVFDRHRPFETQLGPPTSTHSFPSGHSATAFACATVLASLAPRWRAPFFVLAALIALSRVYNGVHYPTDVLGGALLGVLVGLAVLRVSKRGWRLRPSAGLEEPLR